jgi:hypothetical protein
MKEWAEGHWKFHKKIVLKKRNRIRHPVELPKQTGMSILNKGSHILSLKKTTMIVSIFASSLKE